MTLQLILQGSKGCFLLKEMEEIHISIPIHLKSSKAEFTKNSSELYLVSPR